MTWSKTEEQIVLPRYERGMDHGTERYVLARRGNHEIVFDPGCKYFGGIETRSYAPACVELGFVGRRDERGVSRFSQARVAAAAPQIAKWLGVEVSELPPLARRATFVWQDDEHS